MKNSCSRRAFLKQGSMAAVLSGISLSAWSSGLLTLQQEGVKPDDEFSLLKLDRILPGYSYKPAGKMFSPNSFELEYDLFNMYHTRDINAGRMNLKESVTGQKRLSHFHNERLANTGVMKNNKRFRYFVSGYVESRNDKTNTPQQWESASKIATASDGKAWMNTELKNTGQVRDKKIIINNNGNNIRLDYDNELLTWKWGMISVVQKMANEGTTDLHFACLDEFDRCYNNQSVHFRKNRRLDCGNGRMVSFKVYEHLGDGVIPSVYWVDDNHRTVFVITGMEAYVLNN